MIRDLLTPVTEDSILESPRPFTGGLGKTAAITNDDGFCYLSNVEFTHGTGTDGDDADSRCSVQISPTFAFDWELVNKGGNGSARSVRCDARCVRY